LKVFWAHFETFGHIFFFPWAHLRDQFGLKGTFQGHTSRISLVFL
jgi:hypothetical protein